MGALQPSSGLLGKEYAKEVTGEAGHLLHLRAAGSGDGLWRISVEAVDGWVLPVADADERDGKGPFARLLDLIRPVTSVTRGPGSRGRANSS